VYDAVLGCFISVKIDMTHIQKLQLELDIQKIKEALLDAKNLGGIKLSDDDIVIASSDKIRVFPPARRATGAAGKLLFFHLQTLKRNLPDAVVKGYKSTGRAVVNKDDKGLKFNLLVEGYGLLDVMNTPGIDASRTKSNHVIEVEKCLGIEAARKTIMQEVKETMGGHGIAVDSRHIQMLGDCMTYRGQVLGINRYGISRMRASTLMLASFERTTDHIFDAAVHHRSDPVSGVSECIILGSGIKLGTGLFKLLYDYGGKQTTQSSGQSLVEPKLSVGAGRTPLLSKWPKHRRVL
jgi:DNA-directed RNA polymerase III subunit RPC1